MRDSGLGQGAAAGYAVPKGNRPGSLLDCSQLKISALEKTPHLGYIYRLPYISLIINYKKAFKMNAFYRSINSAPAFDQFLDSPIQTINYNELNNLINCNDLDQYALRCSGQVEASGCLRVSPAGARCPLPILSIQVKTKNDKRKRPLFVNKKRREMNEDVNAMKGGTFVSLIPAMIVESMLALYFILIRVQGNEREYGVMRELYDKNFVLKQCKLLNKEIPLTIATLTTRAIARNRRWPVDKDNPVKTLSP